MSARAAAVSNGVQELCDRYLALDSRLINWARYLGLLMDAAGWNVAEMTQEDVGFIQMSNTSFSNPVFAEVARMEADATLLEVNDTHNAWLKLPRVWRRVVWAMYVQHFSSGEKLGEIAGVDRRHVTVLVKQIFEELELSFRILRHVRHGGR